MKNIVNYVLIKSRILAELMSWCNVFMFDLKGGRGEEVKETLGTPI